MRCGDFHELSAAPLSSHTLRSRCSVHARIAPFSSARREALRRLSSLQPLCTQALIKYYERKGMPLPAHLQEKARGAARPADALQHAARCISPRNTHMPSELLHRPPPPLASPPCWLRVCASRVQRDEVLSSEEAKNPSRSKGAKGKGGAKAKRRTPVQQRLGTAAGVKGGAKAPGRMPVQERLGTSAPVFKPSADHAKWAASRPKGGIVKLSGADGATGSSAATVVAPVQGAGARGADAAAARKERPKGGVRILSGAEGGLANGKKRPRAEEEQGLSKSSRC